MKWRLKSAIQRACATVPLGSEAIYYGIQRSVGSLRKPAPPWEMLSAAASMISWLRDAGLPIQSSRMMEVGTGRRVDLPLGLFLGGAESIDTFDLHRYLKLPLVQNTVRFICDDQTKMEKIFLPVTDQQAFSKRFEKICSARGTEDLIRTAGIRYHAPADATATELKAGSIDVHVSYTVFEHIPTDILRNILHEARRVLSPDGVVLHHVDPSDHFSHDDPEITRINFLKFSEAEWQRHAGNQFAYHNRLRVNDYRKIFEDCGYEILRWEELIDAPSMKLLKSGFPVDNRFKGLSAEVLCSTNFRVLARPRPATSRS